MTGKYDHILGKTADIQYKVLLANLALANETSDLNELKRIELAIKIVKLDSGEKARVEAELGHDLDIFEPE